MKQETFVHLVWATRSRRPMITSAIEPFVFRAIEAKCAALRCSLRAIGGTSDHLHVVCGLHPSIAIVQLAAQLKGFSSWATGRELRQPASFRWQAGYGAFTVATKELPAVASYVFDQKRRHQLGETDPRLENTGQPPEEA